MTEANIVFCWVSQSLSIFCEKILSPPDALKSSIRLPNRPHTSQSHAFSAITVCRITHH